MKVLWHEQWNKNILKKTINIFGKNWFLGKNILEVGCGHGKTGIELLKLGSNVIFTDIREKYLIDVTESLKSYNFTPSCAIIDHNKDYDFNEKFDLLIHIGLLYHLKNWKNDIKNSIKHSDIILLESRVDISNNVNETLIKGCDFPYSSPHKEEILLGEKTIENELSQLGCKFFKFTDKSLNSSGWEKDNCFMHHIYDWTEEKYQNGYYDLKQKNHMYQFRRMWIVLK